MKEFTFLAFDLIGIMILLISITFIVANMIGNHRFSFWASLFSILIAFLYVMRILNLEPYVKYLKDVKDIAIIYLASTAIPFIISLVSLLKENHQRDIVSKFYNFGVSLDDVNTLAYLTSKGKVIKTAKKIDEIRLRFKEDKEFVYIKSISVDNVQIKNKSFMKELVKAGINGVPTVFKFVYSNELIVEIPIIRREIKKSNHIYGYALLDSNSAIDGDFKSNLVKEYRKNLFIYLDLLDEALAYLDEEGENFIASHEMIDLIGTNDNVINRNLIRQLVHPDDADTMNNHKVEDEKLTRVYYRLNTSKGYLWFEESSVKYFGNVFVLLRTVEATKANRVIFGNYKDMTKLVNSLCNDKHNFGIVMLNINNIPEINASLGKDLTDVLISKFFVKILNGPLKDQVKVFKLGSIEYGLIVENEEYMEVLVRDLNNNNSYIMAQDVIVNKIKQRVKCNVGVVSSKDVNTTNSREVMKIALDTLKMATDPDYEKDFYVYYYVQSKKHDYDLKSLGINLETDDLDMFKEDIDKNKKK